MRIQWTRASTMLWTLVFFLKGGIAMRIEWTRGSVILWTLVFLLIGVMGIRGGEAQTISTLDKIRERKELRAATAPVAPFNLIGKDGKWYGMNIDIGEKLATKLGVKLTWVETAWDVAIVSLQTDKFDIILTGMTDTPKRREVIDFTRPHYMGGFTYFVRKDNPKNLVSLDQLNNPEVTIATRAGTSGEAVTMEKFPKAKLKSFTGVSQDHLIAELEAGRSDAIVLDSLLARALRTGISWIRTIPDNDQGIEPKPIAYGVRKNDTRWREYVDAFLNELEASGELDRLVNKWFRFEILMPKKTP